MYDFFLSYATGKPEDDKLVGRLYDDICADVVLHSGRHAEVGFLDRREIRAGMDWSEALVDAVATCTVFVALCSPAYFTSVPCGREWTIFLERLRRARGPVARSALIPLQWVVAEMPPIAA